MGRCSPFAAALLSCSRLETRMYRPRTLQGELSLIEKMLPEEMLLHIFERLPITALAAAQCVCRQWRSVGATPALWRAACM